MSVLEPVLRSATHLQSSQDWRCVKHDSATIASYMLYVGRPHHKKYHKEPAATGNDQDNGSESDGSEAEAPLGACMHDGTL